MNISSWSKTQRARAALTITLSLLAVAFLYEARAALLPFLVGSILAYIMLPLIDWLDERMRFLFRGRRIARSFAVLIVYGLTVSAIVGLLAFVIPLMATEFNVLGRRLPGLAVDVYRAAPEVVQEWLDRYNRSVPQEIRLALERSVQDTLQSLIAALQTGAFRTISVLFSTVSFVIGLFIVPLWMFYFMRDQPEIELTLFRMLPPAYREDMRSVLVLAEDVLSSYLRGQVMLCVLVAVMSTVGLEMLGIDFALLLGTISGLLEVVPVMGPILAAIPMVLVAMATSPSKVLWVVLLAFAVQQIENYVFVPQITHGVVRLHPAMSMLILVIGSAAGGVVGVILSIPIAAMVRDIAHYLYVRLQDSPPPPREALALVRNRSR